MNDTVKHSDDEAIVSLTYTWGGGGKWSGASCSSMADRQPTATSKRWSPPADFDDRIENGMDSLFNGAYDEVEGQLYDAMPENLPDKHGTTVRTVNGCTTARSPPTTTTMARTSHGMARTAMSATI